MNVLCSATPACPIILNSTCVFYEGENLIHIGVNTNDSIQTALEKINNSVDNLPIPTLQEVTDEGNVVIVPNTQNEGIYIVINNSSYQNAFVGEAPLQTHAGASDLFVAKLNGQVPITIPGSIGGFVAEMHGSDNVGHWSIGYTDAGNSKGFVSNSYDGHIGAHYVAIKTISNISNIVFEVYNDGAILGKSFTKIDGLSTEFLKADGSTDSNTYLTNISGITAGGELSGTYPNPSLVNSAVISKLLTGLNITGGTIISTDSILTAFGKVQNQLNGIVGGSVYQGTWDALINVPFLQSGIGTAGYYYVVNVAGTTNLDGYNNWSIGDWAIFNGTVWQKVDNTDAVSSVNGYLGDVSLVTGDIIEGVGTLPGRPSQLYYTDSRSRAAISSSVTGLTYDSVTGIFTLSSGYILPTTTQETNWNTAYSNMYRWDGGSTGLVSSTGRTSLGATTIGSNIFTSTNPSAITFLRANADNTVSWLDAATFRTAIGAGTSTVTPSALTKTDDTNVTITLGGAPNTALLAATSITLGWTGTLADSRIASANTWNAKQEALAGTGLVKSTAGTISYITDNSSNWNTAYSNMISTLTVIGNSGSANLSFGTLNIPTYTLAGLGGQPLLGYTPENIANKQNSLVIDGTGTKYPTVDAVNAGITSAAYWTKVGLDLYAVQDTGTILFGTEAVGIPHARYDINNRCLTGSWVNGSFNYGSVGILGGTDGIAMFINNTIGPRGWLQTGRNLTLNTTYSTGFIDFMTNSVSKLKLNNNGTLDYASDVSSLYTSRTLVDKAYVDARTGVTNLSYTAFPTNGIVYSDTGTDATITAVDFTNAGLMVPLDKQLLYNDSSTGILSFGGLSINTDTTKFDVGAIKAWFINNYTDPLNPTKQYKSFSATTANSVPNITTQSVTYVAIDVNGVLQFSSSPFDNELHRDYCILGVLVHSNRIVINAINNQPSVSFDVSAQLSDLISGIGFFNISGNVFSPNGVNLNINKSYGHVFKEGSNFLNSNKDPHTLITPALVAPTTIRYRLQTGTEYANTAIIDPGYYDLAGVRTAVPGTKYSIQRIYLFQSNLIRIQYGQAIYANMADAIQAISTEAFVVEQNILENGLFRGLLILRDSTTDLTDTSKALFIEASKFGSVAGLGSLSTTNLQQAYNNSTVPLITTNSTLDGFSVKNGTGNADNVTAIYKGQNTAGTNTFVVNADGAITALSFIKTGGTSSQFLKADGSVDSNTYITGLNLITTEINIGTIPKRSGKFNITSSGLTIGKMVNVYQAVGPYTSKGTLADETEMDILTITGKVTSATNIVCYWNSATFVKGNYKFNYVVST